ncbi:MAG: hypothetical protein ACRDTA_15510, partial [Pseudonocardiaceae bacterium]
QHPQRHLIRPHHHTLAHDRRPCQPPHPKRSRHAEPNKKYQTSSMINLSYVALGQDGCQPCHAATIPTHDRVRADDRPC